MLPDADRTALLRGLAATQAAHQDAPEEIGLEAVRLLRRSGATWSDLFGPLPPKAADEDDVTFCRRRALHLAAFATPAQLASLAVLLLGELPTYGVREMNLSRAICTLDRIHDRRAADLNPRLLRLAFATDLFRTLGGLRP